MDCYNMPLITPFGNDQKMFGPLEMPKVTCELTESQKYKIWTYTSLWPNVRYRPLRGIWVGLPCTRQCMACFG